MKPVATYQKLRGGYYTPKPIANFLAQWAIQTPDAHILEPNWRRYVAGGELRERCLNVEPSEVLWHIWYKALSLISGSPKRPLNVSRHSLTHIFQSLSDIGDFFTYCQKYLFEQQLFEAIIGNPPSIRYQNFPENYRAMAFYLMERAGLRPNRLTNAWVPFLVAATLLLSKTGRLAMVIPAELLQVNYAAELRSFLSRHYSYLTLITFKKLVFDGIQQEIVLLLGERTGSTHTGIRTVELDGIDDLYR